MEATRARKTFLLWERYDIITTIALFLGKNQNCLPLIQTKPVEYFKISGVWSSSPYNESIYSNE